MAAVRESASAALEIFAVPGESLDERGTTALPESFSDHEREEVARGCYEMLMVLADAIAEPLPGETASGQARDCAPDS